jgi:hypothetical protein
MTRDEILTIVTQVVGDELSVLRDDLEARIDRLVAQKPIPPFVPPPIWTEGRHGAGSTVRHRNGLFVARRDTEGEPGRDDAWLPLLVGLAGLDLRWEGERTVALRAALSDGTHYEMVQKVAIPIVRGYWKPDVEYEEGDRVFRFGEFHALSPSRGIEPGSSGSDEVWLKVGGKNATAFPVFALDDDGTMTQSGRTIGSLKPMVRELLDGLLTKHATRKEEIDGR